MDDLYREAILDHYKNPRNFGKIAHPSSSYQLYNSACGDKIEIYLKVKGDKVISDIKFSGEGCAISLASASMLTEKVMGKNIEEVKRLKARDIIKMLGIQLSPTRMKCTLLPLEVLEKTLVLAKKK